MNVIENKNFRLSARNCGAELRSFVDKRGKQEYEYLEYKKNERGKKKD